MKSKTLAPEWERQDAIIIVWPHAFSDWLTNLDAIEITYCEICRHISRYQDVILIAYNDAHKLHIQEYLDSLSVNSRLITYANIQTNDTWVRDYGPICINSSYGENIYNFKFDAWGEKYPHLLDDAFNMEFVRQYRLDEHCVSLDFVLEAGNLEINNKGELLCSSTCFKRKNHYTHISRRQLEEQFADWFGCNNINWINDVKLSGDDTGGHIDTLARFCSDDVIVYSAVKNEYDANYESLKQLEIQLKTIQRKSHNRIELIPLPLPKPIPLANLQLPACYTNFLITNECVLVPIFKDKQDDSILKLFDDLFPSRQIIGINSKTLIQQFGGIHCTAMQIPEGILP